MPRVQEVGKKIQGYSLIEVLIAGAILMIAIAAAMAMVLTVVGQQETNIRIARSLAFQEQAARLYQLGLSPAQVVAVLPTEPSVTSLAFANATNGAIGNVAGMERFDCVMVFRPSAATEGAAEDTWVPGSSTTLQTNTLVVIRPSIR